MHGLDRIFSKHSHVAVLRTLYHTDQPLTGREVQRRSGISNRTAMLALGGLEEARCVLCEVTSREHWYQLNRKHYFYRKVIKPAFEAEELFWDDLRNLVRNKIRPPAIAAVATGPIARDAGMVYSRLSINLLFETGRDRIRAYRSAPRLIEAADERYAIPLTINMVDMNNMDSEEFDSLWRRVAREGILLFGTLP